MLSEERGAGSNYQHQSVCFSDLLTRLCQSRTIKEIVDFVVAHTAKDGIVAEIRLAKTFDLAFREITVGHAKNGVWLQALAQLPFDFAFEGSGIAFDAQ